MTNKQSINNCYTTWVTVQSWKTTLSVFSESLSNVRQFWQSLFCTLRWNAKHVGIKSSATSPQICQLPRYLILRNFSVQLYNVHSQLSIIQLACHWRHLTVTCRDILWHHPLTVWHNMKQHVIDTSIDHTTHWLYVQWSTGLHDCHECCQQTTRTLRSTLGANLGQRGQSELRRRHNIERRRRGRLSLPEFNFWVSNCIFWCILGAILSAVLLNLMKKTKGDFWRLGGHSPHGSPKFL